MSSAALSLVKHVWVTEKVEYPDDDSMMECMRSLLSLWEILLNEMKKVISMEMIHYVVEANRPVRLVSVYRLHCKPRRVSLGGNLLLRVSLCRRTIPLILQPTNCLLSDSHFSSVTFIS